VSSALFVPTDNVYPKGDDSIVCVPTLADGSRRIVAAFTSDSLFDGWSKGRYRREVVPGEQLISILPDDVWLIVNPSSTHPVEFSPKQIDFALESVASHAGLARESVESAHAALGAGIDTLYETLLEKASSVLCNYPEVNSASIMRRNEIFIKAVICLEVDRLSAKRRMLLFSEVADVSRELFELAGAVEVIDIAEQRRWVEFHRKSFESFYRRGKEQEWTLGDSPRLSEQVETTAIRKRQASRARKRSLIKRLFNRF